MDASGSILESVDAADAGAMKVAAADFPHVLDKLLRRGKSEAWMSQDKCTKMFHFFYLVKVLQFSVRTVFNGLPPWCLLPASRLLAWPFRSLPIDLRYVNKVSSIVIGHSNPCFMLGIVLVSSSHRPSKE